MRGLTQDGQSWHHRAPELVRAVYKQCVGSLDWEDYRVILASTIAANMVHESMRQMNYSGDERERADLTKCQTAFAL